MRQRVRQSSQATFLLGPLVFLAACSGGTESAADQEPAARSLPVTMQDIAFEPDSIVLQRGERVELQLANQGSMEHDFTVDDMPVDDVEVSGSSESGAHSEHEGPALHVAVGAGSTGTIDFRASDSGRYEFYCTVEGHRVAGMAGTITVE